MEGMRPSDRLKNTCRQIVGKKCERQGLKTENDKDHIRWKKQIRNNL